MKKTTRENIAAALLIFGTIALALFGGLAGGCESRSATVTREDGTTLDYRRVTLFGDSSSEGLNISRDGDSYTVEVGSTGSRSTAEIAIEAFGIGAAIGRQAPSETP